MRGVTSSHCLKHSVVLGTGKWDGHCSVSQCLCGCPCNFHEKLAVISGCWITFGCAAQILQLTSFSLQASLAYSYVSSGPGASCRAQTQHSSTDILPSLQTAAFNTDFSVQHIQIHKFTANYNGSGSSPEQWQHESWHCLLNSGGLIHQPPSVLNCSTTLFACLEKLEA